MSRGLIESDATRTSSEKQVWSVVAPFFVRGKSNAWLDDQLHESDLDFRKVARVPSRESWHTRSRRATGLNNWIEYWHQSRRAFPAAGVITVFPQLAITAAIQKSAFRRDVPLIAWCFNLGQYPGGWKRTAARSALRSVDRFIVHSNAEVDRVSEFLGLQPGKVEFVPLQRAAIPVYASEERHQPFVVSMGSANRDYATLLKAAEISKLPCKIVASPRSLAGLRLPANVTVESGLTRSACHALAQRSRFSVIPLSDPTIASGQVTVIESMRMNRAVIATESIGTADYLRDGWNGRSVAAGDYQALASAMLELWENPSLRNRYAEEASRFADESLSDVAAARALARVIGEVQNRAK